MPKFIVETSARHVHVTQETLETLFGKGATLTKKKDLSQPGQFACEERVTVVGPKRELANVSILGPVRKADQIELSATDARSIGVAAPIRESGDTAGSGACKLVGPCGEVECSEGVIVAKRHIHMTPADAETFGCGTIVMNVKDVDTPVKEVKSIKAPRDVLAQLDKYININRDRYRVRGRDMVGGDGGHCHDHDDFDIHDDII